MGACLKSQKLQQTQQDRIIRKVKITIDSYQLIVTEKISSGGYGDIWKYKDIKSGTIFAGKAIKLQNNQLIEMYKREISWLEQFKDVPGILRFIGYSLIDTSRKAEKSKNKIADTESDLGLTCVIITELYDMSLYDLIKNKKMASKDIFIFLKQICSALRQIHKRQCLHLDIKLQNILCKTDASGFVSYAICDFGSSMKSPIIISKLERKEKHKLKQKIQANSTLIYRSPEMIQLDKIPITQKADIWMLGCILYTLVYRKHPFEGQGQLGIITGIVDYPISTQMQQQEVPSNQNTDKLRMIIQRMLDIKAQNRIGEQQILKIIEQ